MSVDEKVFFREATLRICSSLNIVEALKSCFGYIKPYVPTNRIFFHIYNADLNLTRIVASVGDDMMEEPERILYYPEKGRNERAAMLNEDLLKNEVVIRIWNQPDQMEGLPEILERLGLNAKTSLMNMLLKLVEGNQIASLALFANGLNQYTAEHARLLKLLHEPFAISISNALRHQEIIRFKDELMSHLRFFQNMDRINRAMQGTNDLEEMMIDVLDAMLSIFDSERAFLLYPCDPDAPSFEIAMERTRPEYPARRSAISTAPDNAKHFQLYLASSGAVTLGPGCDYPLETSRFGEKSKIMMALHPKIGKPWVLGMHQCSYPRVWSRDEKNLLEEIARRMNDVLTGLLAYRDLHESEERHRVTLQTAMDGFLRADTQGRILEVNETYCRMSGYSEQELLTMNIEDIEAVHSAEMIAATMRRLAELGSNRFESVHRRKDGSLFDVEISGQYQPIASGQAVIFIRDITERKRAEQKIRRQEKELRRVLDVTPQLVAVYGPDRERLYANQPTLDYFGVTLEEWQSISDPFWVFHPDDREHVATDVYTGPGRDVPHEFEGRLRRKDGVDRWFLFRDNPLRNEQGRITSWYLSATDIEDRKRAEETLRQSEAYLAEAQRLSYTGSWAYDLASDKYIYLSEECFRIFELDPQEDLPTREAFARLIHPEDYDKVHGEYKKSLREKVDTSIEFRVALPSGAAKYIQAIQHPVLNEAGDVVRIVGTVIDVTERKRAEEALRLASVYNRSLIEASLDPLVTIDKEGKISDVNAATEQVTGYARSELIGTDFSDYFTEPEKARSGYRKVFSEGLVRDYELNIRHRDGKITPVIYNASVYRDEAGNAIGVFAAARDIRERKRAEAEINSLKNYLSNIIDSMPSILVGMDNTRTVTQWNRQAEAFTGIPAGEAIGKPVVHLLPDFAPWIMTMETDMDEHRPSSMEKLLIEKEGEPRFYDLMLYPLLTDAIGGAVLRIEDVTERTRIQELMVQTEKMMSIGGLAAGMAHEINNPLGIITQAAQNIDRRISLELHTNRKASEELGLNLEGIRAYFDKRQITDAIASIRMASSRAAKIVANMLQLSRRADTTMEFTSLAQIVDQALELAASDYDLKKKYDFRSIDIIKDYQDTPQVPIISVEMEQVILNLFKNAAQAMTANPPDRRPCITLRLRCEDRYAVLEVEDNGPGMTEDIRRRVFEPFFTTKEPGVGTGLGLSVSYMIVTQNHKGLMEVQSTPGRGTVFTVRLPIGGSKT
jgi:PAS domain S-box-containing protein